MVQLESQSTQEHLPYPRNGMSTQTQLESTAFLADTGSTPRTQVRDSMRLMGLTELTSQTLPLWLPVLGATLQTGLYGWL